MDSNIKQSQNTEFFPSSLKSGLYVITCIPEQKHYIGQSENVVRRLNSRKSHLKRNIHENAALQKDYNAYRENEFLWQKLQFGVGFSKQEREDLETRILSTLPEKHRYNVYENWRKRGSKSNPFYGKTHSPEVRQNQSNALRGKPSNFSGKKQTDAVKQAVSKANASKKDRRKPLYIDLVYYESITQAHIETKLSKRLIRDRANSQNPRFQNYVWATETETET